jgi:pimeloyl-ACP methyl ester carboxylesterase
MTLSKSSIETYPYDRVKSVSGGNGNPFVVLIHGWGGDERTLALISDRLATHRAAHRLALPGFGMSPEPAEAWGTPDYVEFLKAWLDMMKLTEPVDIIGHSYGGKLSIAFGAAYPERVRRIVLIASAGLKPHRSFKVRLKRLFGRMLRNAAIHTGGPVGKWAKKKREELGSEDWKRASPLMRATLSRVLEEDYSQEMKALACPVLLIWGEKDTATPLWMGRAMELLIPGSRLVVHRKAGHYCFLDRPGETISEIWKHLELPEAW